MNFIVGFVQSPIFKDINIVTTGNRLVLRAKECNFSSVLILFKENSTLYDLAFKPIIIHSSWIWVMILDINGNVKCSKGYTVVKSCKKKIPSLRIWSRTKYVDIERNLLLPLLCSTCFSAEFTVY